MSDDFAFLDEAAFGGRAAPSPPPAPPPAGLAPHPSPVLTITVLPVKVTDGETRPQGTDLDEITGGFDALASLLTVPKIGGKYAAGMMVPATFRPCPPVCRNHGQAGKLDCGGGKRHKLGANVASISGLMIDCDKLSEAQHAYVLERLEASGYTCAGWETASHNPPLDCRRRALIPFVTPLAIEHPAQWTKFAWGKLMEHLGIRDLVDKVCATPSHGYYLATKPNTDAQRAVFIFDGVPLDAQKILGPLPTFESVTPRALRVDPQHPADLEKIRARMASYGAEPLRTMFANVLAGRPVQGPEGARTAVGTDGNAPDRRTAWRDITCAVANFPEAGSDADALMPLFVDSIDADPHHSYEEVRALLEGALPEAEPYREEARVKDLGNALTENTRKKSEGLTTDESAPADSYAGKLLQAKADLTNYFGKGEASEERLAFEPGALFVRRPRVPTRWRVTGLIPHSGVFVVGGEPKTAKTWSGLELLMAISTGTPAFGEFQTTGSPVTVAAFLAEDQIDATQNRVRSLAHFRGLSTERACERMYFKCKTHLDVTQDDQLCALMVAIRDTGAAVVLIDPFRDITSAEENDSGEISRTMSKLRAIRDLCDVAVIFVHHTGKASKDTAGRRKGQTLRGSSAMHGAVDGGIYLSLKPGTNVQFNADVEVELKAARSASAFKLTLDVIDDVHGEAEQATWTHRRAADDESAEVKAADLELQKRVFEFLTKAWAGLGLPLSAHKIREEVKASLGRVIEALTALVACGDVERGPGGKGYRLASSRTQGGAR